MQRAGFSNFELTKIVEYKNRGKNAKKSYSRQLEDVQRS